MNATDYAGITDATLEQVRKAQTNGVTASTGLVGYDLSGVVSLVPVNTPWFDRVARKPGDGSKAAVWRALLNVNNAQPNPFVGFDQGGGYIKISEQDVLAPYVPVRVSGAVTRDAIDLAKNYADAKAIAVTSTLMQWRIQENKALLGGQAFALPTIGTPVVVDSVTGGSIAASTAVNVKVAARSGMNYYWGGSGVAGSQGTVTTSTVAAATHSATVTVAAVKGAVAYDWWVGGYYYTTTVVNTVVITAIPTANAGTVPSLPGLYTTAPTVLPTADTSYSANSYNGLIASCVGDYSSTGLVTPGGGTSSGATFTSLNGGTLTANAQGVAEIDTVLLALWNSAQCSPTAMLINGQEAQDIKAKILGTNAAITYLNPDAASRDGVIGGGSVAGYINGASGGDRINIVVDPHLPPGRIGFVTERVAYPNSGIANSFEARCLRDVSEFDYGAQLDTTPGNNGGPREVWDVSSTETFVNRFPVGTAWLTEIAAG
jgi:hypothetical protein